MPGIPCIYYGSEWGITGVKDKNSDDDLRPEIKAPEWNDLTTLISSLALIRKEHKSLIFGEYKSVVLTNRQLIFEREFEGERIWVGVNADNSEYYARFNSSASGAATDLLSSEKVYLQDGYMLPPYSLFYWKHE